VKPIKADDLVERYVACFSKFDDLAGFANTDPIASQLATGEVGTYGEGYWRPRRVETQPTELEPIYAQLPARFPPLFERLVLSYRWAEVELGSYTLLANPPGDTLDGLLARDINLTESLIPAGFMQFAKGPGGDYDPVCFNLRARKKNREFSIVKIDHEEILCNYRVKVVAELAPSFEQLVRDTIDRAPATNRRTDG
jgi:hypothetical protein